MIEQLPTWVDLLFLLTTVLTIVLFYLANEKSIKLIVSILLWSILHSLLAFNGFYESTSSIPPRFLLILIPVIATIFFGLTKKNRTLMASRRKILPSTLLHIIRIPVEVSLYFLYLDHMIPELMTFEGRNFDILAGLTAPLMAALWWKQRINPVFLLIWNFIGLGLVLVILVNGLLSSELPIQLFAFDQPNRAISYFPYVLLPATVVPLVIYSHLIDIVKLLDKAN